MVSLEIVGHPAELPWSLFWVEGDGVVARLSRPLVLACCDFDWSAAKAERSARWAVKHLVSKHFAVSVGLAIAMGFSILQVLLLLLLLLLLRECFSEAEGRFDSCQLFHLLVLVLFFSLKDRSFIRQKKIGKKKKQKINLECGCFLRDKRSWRSGRR